MQNLRVASLLLKSNVHRPFLFHSILWTLAFTILIFVFTQGQSPVGIDFIYTTAFLMLISIPVCINFYWLIPKYLKREKYLKYLLLFLGSGVIFGGLIYSFFQPLLDILFPSYFFISYLTNNNLIIVILIFLISTTLLKLGEDWFYYNSNENRLWKLKSQHFETQLSALRSQMNPHFLFNSLNVIYALALEKNELITKAIVELSDILRYVIYDSNTERVTLKEEIELLKNYIAFQNHRLESIYPPQLHISVENDDYKVYPMLLLPLLENSYKHGTISGTSSQPIKIELSQKKEIFRFRISNPVLDTQNTLKDKYSGVGLENLKNNLALIYPKQHEFKVLSDKNTFTVSLEITDYDA